MLNWYKHNVIGTKWRSASPLGLFGKHDEDTNTGKSLKNLQDGNQSYGILSKYRYKEGESMAPIIEVK